jgi:hypothetical protein
MQDGKIQLEKGLRMREGRRLSIPAHALEQEKEGEAHAQRAGAAERLHGGVAALGQHGAALAEGQLRAQLVELGVARDAQVLLPAALTCVSKLPGTAAMLNMHAHAC